MTVQKTIVDDLHLLIDALPERIRKKVQAHGNQDDLLEIVLDLGRLPEARYIAGDVLLDDKEVTDADLSEMVARIGEFGDDNRAGIERTLHRISAIRNRHGRVVGLTCRVGRAVYGTIRIIEDLVLSGKSVLLLGRPGVGKTTMLREVARVLSTDARKRVIVVDTSNEIAGDGDIPHPAIGRARRMQVQTPLAQHAVMIEAVENHMPEVIIIDEMGTEEEAGAARTIAERGVQLIATAHGNTLENLIMNPTLSDLVGGIQSVTLGDEEARRRGTQKTVLERKSPPTFDIVVEIQSRDLVAVHEDVASTVDDWLRGHPITPEVRTLDMAGNVVKRREVPPITAQTSAAVAPWGGSTQGFRGGRGDRRDRGERRGGRGHAPVASAGTAFPAADRAAAPTTAPAHTQQRTSVFVMGVSRERVDEVAASMGVPVETTGELKGANVLLTTRAQYRRANQVIRRAEEQGTQVFVLRKNSPPQIEQFVRTISGRAETLGLDQEGGEEEDGDRLTEALNEAQRAVDVVVSGARQQVDLTPQRSYVRRLQHLVAERNNLASVSAGREPQRRVTIFRP